MVTLARRVLPGQLHTRRLHGLLLQLQLMVSCSLPTSHHQPANIFKHMKTVCTLERINQFCSTLNTVQVNFHSWILAVAIVNSGLECVERWRSGGSKGRQKTENCLPVPEILVSQRQSKHLSCCGLACFCMPGSVGASNCAWSLYLQNKFSVPVIILVSSFCTLASLYMDKLEAVFQLMHPQSFS